MEIWRGDDARRRTIAKSLPALIGGGEPFLIALTDRLPTDVLASLGTMFDKAVVRIFSKATSEAKPIPGPHAEGGPSPRFLAATIGGIVLAGVLLVAAGRSCGKAGGGDEAGGREVSTNSVPHRRQGGEPTGETQRGDSTNGVPLSVTAQAQVMTNEEDRASSQVNREASHDYP